LTLTLPFPKFFSPPSNALLPFYCTYIHIFYFPSCLHTKNLLITGAFLCSRRKSKPMVRSWRSSIHHRFIMHGPTYDTGSGIPLFGPRTSKVCAVHDLGVYGILLGHCLSMVLLGLFFGFQRLGHQWLHWQPQTFRPSKYTWKAVSRLTTYS